VFYIAEIDGNRIPYDPVEFRARRDLERVHPISVAALESSDAAVFESSKDDIGSSEFSVYTKKASSNRAGQRAESPAVLGIDSEKENSPVAVFDEKADSYGSEESSEIESVYEDELDGEDEAAVRAVQVMSSPVSSLTPESSIEDAGRLFRDQRYRYIPVVSEADQLVGIVSDRDYLNAVLNNQDQDEESISTKQVGDIMVRNVLTAQPNAELAAISEVFFRERIGAMPITDESGKIAGMITRSDVLRATTVIAPIQPPDQATDQRAFLKKER
jgi:CBS domain-containing protein